MAPTSASQSAASNPRSSLAIIIPIFAALACILCLPPLVIHIKGRNFAASVLMVSFLVPNMFSFINAFVWPTRLPQDWWNGHVLCDIEIKLQLASSAANVGAVACIFRQLAIILDTDRTTLVPSPAQRLRKHIFEIIFCVGVPIYLMAAHYFVQSSRYYIFSVEGCRPAFDSSWVSVVLVFIWPLALCLVATVYGSLAAYRLVKHRKQVSLVLAASTTNMTTARFFRLFALSTSLILVYLPLTIFTFQQNVSFSYRPYSWRLVHPSNWSDLIEKIPGQVDGGFDRWIQIGTAFLVFPFFGLGQDARVLYRSWLLKAKLSCSTTLNENSSGQTCMVTNHNGSDVSADSQHGSDLDHGLVTYISSALQNESTEKISSIDVSSDISHCSRSWQGVLPSTQQTARRARQDFYLRHHPRHLPAFEIWMDEEPASALESTQPIRPENEFELTEHSFHQQV